MVTFFAGLATIAAQEFPGARERNLGITRYLAEHKGFTEARG